MERLTMIDGLGNDELVRCMGCSLEKAGANLENCGYCEEGWQKALKKLAAYEDAGLAPGWISVKERQPTVREDVLVLYANGRIAIDWIHFTGDYSFEEMYGRVTHWMPLPKPPEVD